MSNSLTKIGLSRARKFCKKIPRSRQGLTMIEVMVSMMIISIAFAGLMQSFPLGLAINKQSENSAFAYYLAQEKLEALYSLDYDGIPTGVIEAKERVSLDLDDYRYAYQRQTSVSYVDSDLNDSLIDTGLKKISVTIYYPDALAKSEKSYNITTLISKK